MSPGALTEPRPEIQLPTSFPLPYYPAETCLEGITRLPSFSLFQEQPIYRFPGQVAPLEAYLSHLPPERLGLDKASRDGFHRPKDHASVHPDNPDTDRTLYMGTELQSIDGGPRLAVKDRRWSLVWILPNKRVGGSAAMRAINLEPSGSGPDKYYINVGPVTRADYITTLLSESRTQHSVRVSGVVFMPISSKKLSYAQRQELEGISWNIGVIDGDQRAPQTWLSCVLAVAVARGLLEEEDVLRVLNEAVKSEPGPEGAFIH